MSYKTHCKVLEIKSVLDEEVIADLEAKIDRLTSELATANAVVATLPVTEDGVPVSHGDVTYCDEQRPFAHQWQLSLRSGEPYGDHLNRTSEKHFSTREAAENAKGKL